MVNNIYNIDKYCSNIFKGVFILFNCGVRKCFRNCLVKINIIFVLIEV